MNSEIAPSTWRSLRQFTPARVALGRAGGSVPTAALLEFRLAHAKARDALLRPLNETALAQLLHEATDGPVVTLESAARDFNDFLLRPDLGRILSPASMHQLEQAANTTKPIDLAVMVSEGLSTLAVESHAADVLKELLPRLRAEGWQVSPTLLVRRARVAIQDQIGEILRAKIALILLGERPGLVSPDSLGAYLVHNPHPGNTDAQRNCVSNISAQGLTAGQAAAKLHWLLSEAKQRNLSGVELKDEFDPGKQLQT